MEYSQAVNYCQPTTPPSVDGWRRDLLNRLWPSTCVLCRGAGQREIDLCSQCEADLVLNTQACARCAAPLAAEASVVCGGCLRRAPHFHASTAPLRYAYPTDRLIQGLKYHKRGSYGRLLGVLLARRLQMRPAMSLPQLIIPTPLSLRRYRMRGFNQAIELARPLRAALCIPVRPDLVVRTRDTPEQTGLKQRERRRNVRGAFAMAGPLPAHHVAILDDVITTGSTANELAKVLRRAGARRVEVWAAARTSY